MSQQDVTRMQDLATEFSKKFLWVIPPDPYSGRGDPPAPNTQLGLWDPNLGPPQLFSRGWAPGCCCRRPALASISFSRQWWGGVAQHNLDNRTASCS